MTETNSLEKGWQNYAALFHEKASSARRGKSYIDACLKYAQPIYFNGAPIVYDTKHFSRLVGYSEKYLFGAANASSYFYRSFKVSKKSGDFRVIREPLPSLKSVQRWILDKILYQIETNPAAKAYKKASSIKDNARFHVGQDLVLSVDLVRFFDNIGTNRIYPIFRKLGYSKEVATLLANLCCYNGRLPQGAPTSAALSNIVMIPFDNTLLGFCRSRGLRYTRYADDITISGEFSKGQVIGYLRNLAARYGFSLNDKKTRIVGSWGRQQVTGIVVNERMQAPRNKRRKLRQDLYFIKKFGLAAHALKTNQTKSYLAYSLLGEANFVLMINQKDRIAAELKTLLVQSLNSTDPDSD
ncbi:MAG: reverse transcriptase family protein [Pseudomonadota bacterium]